MPGDRIVRFEIPATRPRALPAFRGGWFDLTFAKADSPGPEQWLQRTDGLGIDGASIPRKNPWQPRVEVESVDPDDKRRAPWEQSR